MNASSPRKARASLPVRVALIIIAVALAAVAALAVVNLVAANQYNQATQSLIENIKTSQSQTPDLDKLNAQQQQTDAQFRDAASAGALLLPQLREAIKHNSAVSEQLTKRTLKTRQRAILRIPTQTSRTSPRRTIRTNSKAAAT